MAYHSESKITDLFIVKIITTTISGLNLVLFILVAEFVCIFFHMLNSFNFKIHRFFYIV